jgi:hypothetical protein
MRVDALVEVPVDDSVDCELRALLVVDTDLATRLPQRQVIWLNMKALKEFRLLDELALDKQ